MTRGDIIIVVLVLSLALGLAGFGFAGGPDDGSASVRGPQGTTAVDLSVDGVYRVQGLHGQVVFEVRDGSLRCTGSSCPDAVCVRSGPVAPGRPVVCAPNGVIAAVDRADGGELDAVSR